MWRFGVVAALAFSSYAAAATAMHLDCMVDPSGTRNWVQPHLLIDYSGGSSAAVHNMVILRNVGHPLSARVTQDANGHTVFWWDLMLKDKLHRLHQVSYEAKLSSDERVVSVSAMVEVQHMATGDRIGRVHAKGTCITK